MSPPPDAPSQRTVSPGPVLRLLCWCVLTLAVPVVLINRLNPAVGIRAAYGDDDTLDVGRKILDLRAEKPEYVGIGNSMMHTRLGKTPEQLNAMTGKKFFLITQAGTGSAAWYLTLKNVVIASGVKPKLVFFFIRDNDITAPKFRSAGRNAPYINSIRGKREPVLDRILGTRTGEAGFVERIGDWLNGPDGLLTFNAWDEKMPQRAADLAMDIGGGGMPKAAQRAALAQRFSIENLRRDVAADMPAVAPKGSARLDSYNELNGDYEDDEEQSLLPPMMELADKAGIKLMFFRVKRRPDPQTAVVAEPPALVTYVQHLKQWIESRGGLFYDETYDPAIKESDYLDGDHIRPDRMKWYQ